jgi:hypothetical protein
MKVNNREMYVMTTPPHIRTVKYDFRHDDLDETKEYKIPLPGFCWIIIVDYNPTNNKRNYIHGMVYALKNQILSENDQLYRFPFANVDERWMCWGKRNDYPTIGKSKSIMTIPDQFLNNPTNNHLDHSKYEPFVAEVNGSEIRLQKTSHLFDYLAKEQAKAEEDGKDASFKYDVLRKHTTLDNAINHYTERFLL